MVYFLVNKPNFDSNTIYLKCSIQANVKLRNNNVLHNL